MIEEINNTETRTKHLFRPANLWVWAYMSRSHIVSFSMFVVTVCLSITVLSVTSLVQANRARQLAEDNIIQNFYSDGSGYYRRMDVMPESHILAFVDRYLSLRHSWTPQTAAKNLELAERVTHSKLLAKETKEGDLDRVLKKARQRISQNVKRYHDQTKYPYQIIPATYGYKVRIWVNESQSAYEKTFESTDYAMCFSLVQVDPNSLDWGLETGQWVKDCKELKSHSKKKDR